MHKSNQTMLWMLLVGEDVWYQNLNIAQLASLSILVIQDGRQRIL